MDVLCVYNLQDSRKSKDVGQQYLAQIITLRVEVLKWKVSIQHHNFTIPNDLM